MITVITALLLFAADQISKEAIQHFMDLGETVPLIPHVFHLTYILNPGAAFGILEYQRIFFLLIVVILFAAYFWFRNRIPSRPVYFPVGIGLLLGGALGNAVDRWRLSGVVDFFDFRIWPIFNIADMGICAGVALIVFYFWRSSDL